MVPISVPFFQSFLLVGCKTFKVGVRTATAVSRAGAIGATLGIEVETRKVNRTKLLGRAIGALEARGDALASEGKRLAAILSSNLPDNDFSALGLGSKAALEAQVERLLSYHRSLEKIANSEISNNKFERMVARAKPKPSSQDRLAARVIDLVAMTVIASGMALPRPHQRNKYGRLVPVDPSTLPPLGEGAKLENLTLLSDVARRREEIQARFDRLFDALNVLDRE